MKATITIIIILLTSIFTFGQTANQDVLEAQEIIQKNEASKSEDVVDAYLTIIKYEANQTLNFKKALEYALVIQDAVLENTMTYYELHTLIGKCYERTANIEELKATLLRLKSIENQKKEEFYAFKMHYFVLMLQYYGQHIRNVEVLKTYGKKALSLVKADDLQHKVAILAAMQWKYCYKNFKQTKPTVLWMEYANVIEQITFKNKGEQIDFYYTIAQMLLYLHQNETANQYIQKAKTLASTAHVSVHFLTNLKLVEAKYQWQTNNKPAAYATAKTAISTANDFQTAHLLSLFARGLNDYKKGIAYCNQALTLLQENSKVINTRLYAEVLYIKGYLMYIQYSNHNHTSKDSQVKELQQILEVFKSSIQHQELAAMAVQHYELATLLYNHRTTLLYGYARKVLKNLYDLQPSDELFNQIFEYTEKRKVMTLMRKLQQDQLPQSVFKTIQNQQQAYENAQLALATADKNQQTQLEEALYQQVNALETTHAKLEQQHGNQYNFATYLKYNTPEEVAQQLDDQTLFISYDVQYFGNVLEDWLHITTISNNDKSIIFNQDKEILNHIGALEKLSKHQLLSQNKKKAAFIQHSYALYQKLIAPIQAQLTGKTKLIFALEGHLLRIPMDVLLSENANKPFHKLDYLIRHYEIAYHYSATTYSITQQRPRIQNHELLAFAPVFAKQKDISQNRSMQVIMNDATVRSYDFQNLPYSKIEVNEIAKIINIKGKANVITDNQATKTHLFQQFNQQQYQFIHIATHGLVNYQQSYLSGIACYDQAGNDNIAFSNEIKNQKIQADLVILSTCESGVGSNIRGEGPMAINRSFVSAGANNVMFSLWKVADQPTSELMIDFYKNYNAGSTSYTKALRHAKLTMLSKPATASPRYWAAFVLMGE